MARSPAQDVNQQSATALSVAPESLPAETQTAASLVALMGGSDNADRRESQRHSFPAVQRVAPCRGTAVPTEADFHLVRCHDLSTSGISFYWPTSPNFDQVIVALASPKGTTRVLARVMFHGPQAGQQGQYLIGCRFVRRLGH
jgi:PilZ domain